MLKFFLKFKNNMVERLPIAAFDFDRTLIDRDSLLTFIRFIKGTKALIKLPLLGKKLAPYLIGKLSRQEAKEILLKFYFKGLPFDFLEENAKNFVLTLDRLIKKEAYQKFIWHRSKGHRCLLVSASLDVYLLPWAQKHGFEAVLSSSLELENNIITGHLSGKNCWGEEKKHRLISYLGSQHGPLYAYGDSMGDKEMLEMADFPFFRRFN
jgi:phosphatidylglycerophosphatase C